MLYQTGASIGDTVSTAEIEDAAITPAKLDTGWKLHTTGTFSAASTPFDLTSLPEKKRWLLVVTCIGSAGMNFQIRFNNDSGGNYAYQWINGTTPSQNTGQTGMAILFCNASYETTTVVEFPGDKTDFGCKVSTGVFNGTNLESTTGGAYAGSAVVSRITALLSTGNVTGRYALYYLEDLE